MTKNGVRRGAEKPSCGTYRHQFAITKTHREGRGTCCVSATPPNLSTESSPRSRHLDPKTLFDPDPVHRVPCRGRRGSPLGPVPLSLCTRMGSCGTNLRRLSKHSTNESFDYNHFSVRKHATLRAPGSESYPSRSRINRGWWQAKSEDSTIARDERR